MTFPQFQLVFSHAHTRALFISLSRYRLVRHTWNLNVNESLSLDATCTLNNASSYDLGIDLYVKNQNQVHHALVTEIFLSDLTLFCPTYKFIPNSIKCKFDIEKYNLIVIIIIIFLGSQAHMN